MSAGSLPIDVGSGPGDFAPVGAPLRVSAPTPYDRPGVALDGSCGTGGGGHGVGASMRTVVLGQDAGGLPAEAGLTHADFRVGEPVGPVPNMTSPSFPCHHTLYSNPPDHTARPPHPHPCLHRRSSACLLVAGGGAAHVGPKHGGQGSGGMARVGAGGGGSEWLEQRRA